MSKTRTGGIPPVPGTVPREMRPFLESIREGLEVQMGRRGKAIDRAVTFRDLGDGGIASLNLSLNGGISLSPPSTGGGPVETPPAPTNVNAHAGIDFVLLSWDLPSYNGHAFAEVYRITENSDDPNQTIDVGSAVLIGTNNGFLYSDIVDPQSAHYYWVRFVNVNGVAGPYHSTNGLYAETALSYDAVIDQAREDVLASLSIWQNDITDAMDILDNDYFGTVLGLQETVQAVGTQLILTESRLGTKYDEFVEVVETENLASVEKIEQLTASIYDTDENGNVILDNDGDKVFAGSFITSVDKVTADAFSAEAESRNQLAAAIFQVNPDGSYVVDEDGVPILSGGFNTSVEKVTAEEREATATKLNTVSASIFQEDENGELILDEDGNPILTGGFASSVEAATADEVASTAARIDNLTAEIFERNPDGTIKTNPDGTPKLIGSFIDSVDAVLANIDGELMAAIGDTLTVDNGDVSYSLSEIMSTALDAENKYTAQWGIKTTINDLQYGVGFVARTDDDGEIRTGFHIAADTFSVHNPANGEEVIPFIINEDGYVLIDTLLVDTATITSLVADSIIVGDLFAGKQITSPIIQGGQLIGVTLNVNNKTFIDEFGVLTGVDAYFENGYFQGEIQAESGTLDNVTIKDTCTVEGTVYAQNIEGDVLDRYILNVDPAVEVPPNTPTVILDVDVDPGYVGPYFDRYVYISYVQIQNTAVANKNTPMDLDMVLYLDELEVQRFSVNSIELGETVGSAFGAFIAKGNSTKNLKLIMNADRDSTILQNSICVDVTKQGNSLKNISALYTQ
ncbi:phage tail tip fiber protein [Alteromonas mediterranea]|uniref:Tip attachment protein J central straight fiber domain-containing protein n=1 Tax=Alteromonas mediterranea (strain DSM 17117 / CIP 110805 / LMG 28347 / Deep ecotype) TaxID=1774373 RepID=F2GC87_ALTMD|nr:DUF1983 domain-containing protein [Alteromonas mediterranea]AEA99043.1 hypothetical protein MADE_1014545 [Alteromonas mediterranea DE]